MEDVLYTVKEVSQLIKTNVGYVYNLIKKGYLPALNLGSLKVRRASLLEFLEKYDGKDLSDLDNIKDLNINREDVIDENL
ncbi:MAG: helix-turn-helix domain-containing protein [Bacilli bacterium]